MLLKTVLFITVAFTLLYGGCDEAVEQSSGPVKPVPIVVEAKPKREKPEVLIDTTLQGLGRVQVAYHPTTQKLWIKSWEKEDTISGSTDWVFLKDWLPSPVKPVLGICFIHKNKVAYTNMMLGRGGILFFAIADQEQRANVYAVQKSGKSYQFLCNKQEEGSCSQWDSTPDCKILDSKRNRLLRVSGTDYDEEKDWDIQTIDVYQYMPDAEYNIGTLKINNWRDEQCEDAAILNWYKAYLRIADQESFDQYLMIPKMKKEEDD
jgi:hypothetical protein